MGNCIPTIRLCGDTHKAEKNYSDVQESAHKKGFCPKHTDVCIKKTECWRCVELFKIEMEQKQREVDEKKRIAELRLNVEHSLVSISGTGAPQRTESGKSIEGGRSPETESEVGFFPTKQFNIVILGEVGDGKSAMTQILTSKEHQEKITVSRAFRGVTKSLQRYPVREDILPMAYVFDTPGSGDRDVPLSQLIEHIEKAISGCDVHCVVMTVDTSKGRMSMGATFIATLVEKGFVESFDNVIICGTKADLFADDYSRQEWKQLVAEEIVQCHFGGRCAGICTTSLDMKRRPDNVSLWEASFYTSDISELRSCLERVYRLQKAVIYSAPSTADIIEAGSNILNIDMSSEEKKRMEEEVEKSRAEAVKLKQEYDDKMKEKERLFKEKEKQLQEDVQKKVQAMEQELAKVIDIESLHTFNIDTVEKKAAKVDQMMLLASKTCRSKKSLMLFMEYYDLIKSEIMKPDTFACMAMPGLSDWSVGSDGKACHYLVSYKVKSCAKPTKKDVYIQVTQVPHMVTYWVTIDHTNIGVDLVPGTLGADFALRWKSLNVCPHSLRMRKLDDGQWHVFGTWLYPGTSQEQASKCMIVEPGFYVMAIYCFGIDGEHIYRGRQRVASWTTVDAKPFIVKKPPKWLLANQLTSLNKDI